MGETDGWDDVTTTVDAYVGGRVAAQRRLRGLSIAALAARLGIGADELQAYEEGSERIGAVLLYRLAQALQVPLGAFFASGVQRGGPDAAWPRDAAVRPQPRHA